VAIACAVVVTYDPSVPRQQVYRSEWVWLALASVPLQWLVLALAGAVARRGLPAVHFRLARAGWTGGAWLVVLGLVAIGFWLRLRDIEVEPLQWDEVRNYDVTMGFLKRGFPSTQLPDMPTQYASTSELLFVPLALTALFTQSDQYIVRFPAACFGTAIIVLIFVTGRRLFNTRTGLIVAALYTFSPVCIAMSNFGRYFSQLQFFTLLSVYYFWLTLRGTGPINRRALWLSVVGFIGMYLSWEAAALVALGMMLAALVQRAGRIRSMLANPSVIAAVVVVGLVVIAQLSFRSLQRSLRIEYGTGIDDLQLTPMWRYPIFEPWYYVFESSWNLDAFLPMLGLFGSGVLAIRHRWRRPVRFLLLIHVFTCWIMAALLPVMAWRYIHHMIPFTILLASATLSAALEGVGRLAQRVLVPRSWRLYARGVSLAVALPLILLGSGITVQLPEMDRLRVQGYGLTVFKFPDLGGPSRFLREHLEPGDIVLASFPHSVNHFLVFRQTEYWPQSKLYLQALLDDARTLPLDRRSGAVMIDTRDELDDLFARHRRVWYVVVPSTHANQNSSDLSAFLRQHMDVAYQDFQTMVLLRDVHRRALMRVNNDQTLNSAKANYLP
jgi:4-amino-4-deoxy-L-arabinose transferase-like glycosyltransferase